MPQTLHVEKHFTASDTVRDIVIGMSDGLTVPFALAAGLSGAITNTGIIVTAGIAEIVAGSIAMGLGGYLAAKSDAEHYDNELKREYQEVKEIPNEERKEVSKVFEEYGLTEAEIEPILQRMQANHTNWVNFMMRFELGIEKPEPGRAKNSAATIAGAYIAGGFIPLAPYMLFHHAQAAFLVSTASTLVALFGFGYVKGRFTGSKPLKSAWQTTAIGGLAAAAAFLIAKAIS